MKKSKRAMKKRQWCICSPPSPRETWIKTFCRWGCVQFRCPECKVVGISWGQMGCKCDGYVRWLHYPDMASGSTLPAKKPSLPPGRHKGRVA